MNEHPLASYFYPQASTPAAPTDNTYRWATVEALGPLEIRFDGDTEVLGATPDSLVPESDLIVGARVWCQIYGRHVIVLGTPYRPAPVPPTPPTPEVGGSVTSKTYYEKYPSGLLICKGYHSFPSNANTGQAYAWTFPIPFVGAEPQITVAPDTAAPQNVFTSAYLVDNTSATIRFYRTTSAATGVWFSASGLWK